MHRKLQPREAAAVNVTDDAGRATQGRDHEVFLRAGKRLAAEAGRGNLPVERLSTRRIVVDEGNEFSLGRHRIVTRVVARYTWPRRIASCSGLPSTCSYLPRRCRFPGRSHFP